MFPSAEPERERGRARIEELDRADRVGAYWANPKTRTFAELLIDCEEDKAARSCLGC